MNQAPAPASNDPMPLIRTLQGQRNHALDQLADAQAALAHVESHLTSLQEAYAQSQSQVDELTAQLEATKQALADIQAAQALVNAPVHDAAEELV